MTTLAATDGDFTGLLETISLEKFTDVGFTNVTKENFEHVLAILAIQFSQVSEDDIESAIVSEEDAESFVESTNGLFAEEYFVAWIEEFDLINVDLSAGTWSNVLELSSETRESLEAAYARNGGPLSPLEIMEIIYANEEVNMF